MTSSSEVHHTQMPILLSSNIFHLRTDMEMISLNVALPLKDTLSLVVLPGMERMVHEKQEWLVPLLVWWIYS